MCCSVLNGCSTAGEPNGQAGHNRRGRLCREVCATMTVPTQGGLKADRMWQDRTMAMTASVKDELARLEVTKTCCRKAEVSSLLRFGGGLHLVSGKIVIEAELDTGVAARRLRRDIAEVFGHDSELAVVAAGRSE